MSSIKLGFNDFDNHSVIPIPAVGFRVIGIGLDGKLKKKDSDGVVTDFSDGIPQINSDWNSTTGISMILNKPTNISTFINDSQYATLASPVFIGKITTPELTLGQNTFPSITGTVNQVLTTDGYGLLYWKTPAVSTGGGGTSQDLSGYATLDSPIFTSKITTPELTLGQNTFPSITGTVNQVLTTDGYGLLYWKTPAVSTGGELAKI
jgi:hypothetical protein